MHIQKQGLKDELRFSLMYPYEFPCLSGTPDIDKDVRFKQVPEHDTTKFLVRVLSPM